MRALNKETRRRGEGTRAEGETRNARIQSRLPRPRVSQSSRPRVAVNSWVSAVPAICLRCFSIVLTTPSAHSRSCGSADRLQRFPDLLDIALMVFLHRGDVRFIKFHPGEIFEAFEVLRPLCHQAWTGSAPVFALRQSVPVRSWPCHDPPPSSRRECFHADRRAVFAGDFSPAGLRPDRLYTLASQKPEVRTDRLSFLPQAHTAPTEQTSQESGHISKWWCAAYASLLKTVWGTTSWSCFAVFELNRYNRNYSTKRIAHILRRARGAVPSVIIIFK